MNGSVPAAMPLKHHYRLSLILSRRQEHELRSLLDPDMVELKVACEGRVLDVVLTEKGSQAPDPLQGIRSFLAGQGISFEYDVRKLKAA